MNGALQRFLPNEANRRLFPGFVCFGIAAVGVALGFLGWAAELRWLALIAFLVTAAGVVGGFSWIAYVWWRFVTARR